MSGAPAHPSPPARLPLGKRLHHFWKKEIWHSANLNTRSPRGVFYGVMRVISITSTVFRETHVPARAAALSFSSLLGLGPLIAIAVLIGGFMLGNSTDPNLVAGKLAELMERVVPQLQELEKINAALDQPGMAVNPKVVDFVTGIINGAKSGTGGVFGALSLILIVLLLFKSVEDAVNDIWGVRQGRSVLMRIVYYWTILTLGAVLFFAAVTLLGAGAFFSLLSEPLSNLPGGHELVAMLKWTLPMFSFTLVAVLLTLVYRVIPNTHVFWSAAFSGALVVVALLMLNNYVAMLYVRRVLLTQSLYGSLALPLVLMLGLYIFWLYILIGGVISYAVQNVHYRNSQAAWSSLNETMRERLCLVVLLTICRRFQACLPPVSAVHLGTVIKVPTQVLNECLNRLVDMKLITPVPPAPDAPTTDLLYQPARPLSRINLYDFKTLDDTMGDDPVGLGLERIDPILAQYDAALATAGEQPFFKKSLDELFAEQTVSESRAPFTLGQSRSS